MRVLILLLAATLSLYAQIGTTGAMVGRSARVVGPSFPAPSSSWLVTLAGSGQTVADSSGSFNCTRGADSGESTDDPAWDAVGLDFDGGDFLNCGAIYGTNLQTTPMTMCITGIFDLTGGTRALVGRQDGSNVGYALEISGGWRLNALVTVTTNQLRITGNTTPSTGTWYHVCVAMPAAPTVATTEIYVNGTLASESSTVDTLSTSPSYTTGFNIGAKGDGASGFIDGRLGLIRRWEVELDAAGVAYWCNDAKTIMASRSVTLTCP